MRTQQGFSLLELLLASCLVMILASATYIRYVQLVVDAEVAAFKGAMSWLQAGVNLTLGDAYSRQQLDELRRLQTGNPMRLLTQVMTPPSNYLGELTAAEGKDVPPAHWYYDLDQRRLVYHVRYTQNLNGLSAENQRISFRLDAITPLNGDTDRQITGRLKLVADDYGFWQSPFGSGQPPRTIDEMELVRWSPIPAH